MKWFKSWFKVKIKRCYPLPKRHISDSFKLKEFADDNLKFDESSRKFSKRVKNAIGKGEIVPFSTVFSKDLCWRHVKSELVWKKV